MTKKFTIDRAKWDCGPLGPSGARSLLGVEGMCCLGFYAAACGVSDRGLRGTGYPYDLTTRRRAKLSTEIVNAEEGNTGLCHALVEANDDEKLSPKKREAKIAKLFGKAGITVTFKGEYKDDE